MRMNKLLATLAFSMLFSSGMAVSSELSDFSSEPSHCYEAAFVALALSAGADGVAR